MIKKAFWNSVGRDGKGNHGSCTQGRIVTLKVLFLLGLAPTVPASGVVAANTGPPLLSTYGHFSSYEAMCKNKRWPERGCMHGRASMQLTWQGQGLAYREPGANPETQGRGVTE